MKRKPKDTAWLKSLPTRVEDLSDEDFSITHRFTVPLEWERRDVFAEVNQVLRNVSKSIELMVWRDIEIDSENKYGEGSNKKWITFSIIVLGRFREEEEYDSMWNKFIELLKSDMEKAHLQELPTWRRPHLSPWAKIALANCARRNLQG